LLSLAIVGIKLLLSLFGLPIVIVKMTLVCSVVSATRLRRTRAKQNEHHCDWYVLHQALLSSRVTSPVTGPGKLIVHSGKLASPAPVHGMVTRRLELHQQSAGLHHQEYRFRIGVATIGSRRH